MGLTEEQKKIIAENDKFSTEQLINKMLSMPLFTQTERFKKLSGGDTEGTISFEEKIIDGKMYIGSEILDYYDARMRGMSWTQKVEYAAREKGFEPCSVEEYQTITDMECPEELERIYILKDLYTACGTEFSEYTFLFGCRHNAYYYYLIRAYEKGKLVLEDDNMFRGNDVFRKLRMMRGAYENPHKYD